MVDRVVKIAGLSAATIVLSLGSVGCDKILSAVKKSQKHAAIAYDVKTGGWGYSHDHLTKELAEEAATKKCPKCEVQLTWNQGCGALAQSKEKKDIMTTALGDTRKEAEGAAKDKCEEEGGGSCKILVYACNSTN